MLSPNHLRTLRESPLIGANKLFVAMRLIGTTQLAVAKAIGVSQAQVSDDVNGKYSTMPLEKAQAYAGFFGCAVEDLFPSKQAVA